MNAIVISFISCQLDGKENASQWSGRYCSDPVASRLYKFKYIVGYWFDFLCYCVRNLIILF